MLSEDLKKEKLDLLEWLDGYEAWNSAFQIAAEHHVLHDEHHIFYYFIAEEKKWKAARSQSFSPKNCKSKSGLVIDASCAKVEFDSAHYHLKINQPEFEDIVRMLIEGSKNFIKRYYS